MRHSIVLAGALTVLAIACSSGSATPDPGPSADAVANAGGAYLALGDSLSFGIGATDPGTRGFVALVHETLGADIQLLNLSVPGHTSSDLLAGPLPEATEQITARKADADPANDVRLVTLEIGGNDLLSLYFSLVQTGQCPDVETSLNRTECSAALRSAFDGFRPNLTLALDAIAESDASLPVYLLTLYNPFDFIPGVGALGDLSLEGEQGTEFEFGLNDIIREVAANYENVHIVNVYPLFDGSSAELVASDFIHPNDAGYRVMADAVIQALPGDSPAN
jgi:lysophospholipase L1-like esterase